MHKTLELLHDALSVVKRIDRMAEAGGVVANDSNADFGKRKLEFNHVYSHNKTDLMFGWSVYVEAIGKYARLSHCADASFEASANLVFAETTFVSVLYDPNSKKWSIYYDCESKKPNPPDGIAFAEHVGATREKREIDEARAYEIIATMIAYAKEKAG